MKNQPENLNRLLDELASSRMNGGKPTVDFDTALPVTESQLRKVPLVHGMSDVMALRHAVEDGALRSRADRGLPQNRPEEYLEIKDVVYTSAGVLYPDMNFAVILSPEIEERVSGEASPWDSGSMHRTLCAHLPPPPAPDRREMFLACTISAPSYRTYLVHYVATCFHSALNYLMVHPYAFQDPIRAMGDHWPSRIFEVRFCSRIPLKPWSIEAIFASRDSRGKESIKLRKNLEHLEQDGVSVKYYDGASKTLKFELQYWMLHRTGCDRMDAQ